VAGENNTRNAGMKRLMAALYILRRHPARKFGASKPFPKNSFFERHSDVLNALGSGSAKSLSWKTKSAAETTAQAWSFHYYVSTELDLHSLKSFPELPFVLCLDLLCYCIDVDVLLYYPRQLAVYSHVQRQCA
jgi:hypothetical protein